MSLSIHQLNKRFGDYVALQNIDLKIGPTEFVCLLGPSGCGKTTLLRIIAGLLTADTGTLELDGKDLAPVPARERGFGIVFQSYSLFPYMTVAENVGYGLMIRKRNKHDISRRVTELLRLVKLEELADRLPGQLSGGQQQRVALARALAVDPALILLDEPLSALDARVRTELRAELRELQRRLEIPTLMVTHDQEEAMVLADTIVCMNVGRIEQVGSPHELYLRPKTRFVAEFMGHSNMLSADWLRHAAVDTLNSAPHNADTFQACVRPESVVLNRHPDGLGHVIDTSFLGNVQRLRVECHERELLAELPSGSAPYQVGERVNINIDPAHCSWVQA